MIDVQSASATIRARLNAFLAEHSVFVTPFYQGVKNKEGWERHTYDVHFSRSADVHNGFEIEYGEGMGHSGNNANICDIMHCLTMDYYAYGLTFEEFCSEYGYDEDSRKAEGIYNAVCEQNKKFGDFFTGEEIETLRDILQDY